MNCDLGTSLCTGVDSVVAGALIGAGKVNPSKLSRMLKVATDLKVVEVSGAAVGLISNLVASVTGTCSSVTAAVAG